MPAAKVSKPVEAPASVTAPVPVCTKDVFCSGSRFFYTIINNKCHSYPMLVVKSLLLLQGLEKK